MGFFNAGMVRAKHVTAMMMQMLVAMSVRRLRLAICMQQGRAAGPCTHGRVMHAAVKEPLSYSHSRDRLLEPLGARTCVTLCDPVRPCETLRLAGDLGDLVARRLQPGLR